MPSQNKSIQGPFHIYNRSLFANCTEKVICLDYRDMIIIGPLKRRLYASLYRSREVERKNVWVLIMTRVHELLIMIIATTQ